MYTRIYLALFALALPLMAAAQSQPEVIALWERGAPGFENRKHEPEIAQDWWVGNIHNPSLTVFRPSPDKATGCAVVVAPGGGFRGLVFEEEGRKTAEYLNTLGVTAFVLKYRLPGEAGSPYTLENVRQDARRALRIVRTRSAEFKIDPNRIGIMGYSAGGTVVMLVAFESGDGDRRAPDPVDRTNGRPDFQMMVYPWGETPQQIPSTAPPAFLICANDDDYGCDSTTMDLFKKFRAAKVSVEAHFLARGKHAFNMGNRSEYASVKNWPQRMADWLRDGGFLGQPASLHRSEHP